MGKLVIDTLRLVREAERMGVSHEEAERAACITRDFVVEAYEQGMTVDDIKAEFARMASELRQERISRRERPGA